MKDIKDSFLQKDKSTLAFLIGSIFILLLLITFVLILDKQRLLALAILTSGVAIGWFIGILVSPMAEYNNEATTFAKAQQLLSTFITGALAVKLLQWLDHNDITVLFSNFPLLSRILYFTAATIFAGIIVYYERVYLDDRDVARISFRNSGLGPNEVSAISIEHLNDLLKVCVVNKGSAPLRLLRADVYDPDCTKQEPIPGQPIGINSKPVNYAIKSIAPQGKFLFVLNQDPQLDANFKLRIF